MKNKLFLASLFAMAIMAGCIKNDFSFDQPPPCDEPLNIAANSTIQHLRALHVSPGGYDKITDSLIVKGTIVMDDRSGNYYKTMVIQDSTGGIEVKFNDGYLASNGFTVGRIVYIRCKDLILSDYNGLVQLAGGTQEEAGQISVVGLTEAQVKTKVVKGSACYNEPTPRTVGIQDINSDLVSTLIRFEDVEFIKADTAKTYANATTHASLNRTVENCSGLQVLLRTSGYADFAGIKTPRGKGSLTGVLGIYNGIYQLYIRDLNDVEMDGDRCGVGGAPLNSLNEGFDGTSTNVDIDLAGWVNVAVQGNRIWRGASFSGDKFASATAYNSSLANMESWLITPALNLATPKTLSFTSSSGYYVHDGLTVWVSTDFDGSNVAGATWTQLNFTKPPSNASGYSDFVPSGNISLPISNTKGYIGFKYSGDTNTNTTTWRFDNVKVQ